MLRALCLVDISVRRATPVAKAYVGRRPNGCRLRVRSHIKGCLYITDPCMHACISELSRPGAKAGVALPPPKGHDTVLSGHVQDYRRWLQKQCAQDGCTNRVVRQQCHACVRQNVNTAADRMSANSQLQGVCHTEEAIGAWRRQGRQVQRVSLAIMTISIGTCRYFSNCKW